MRVVLILITLILAGCFDNDSKAADKVQSSEIPEQNEEQDPNNENTAPDTNSLVVPLPSNYSVYPESKNFINNKEAVIPPQCYTKHEGNFNPCMTCHQSYKFGSRPNMMFDQGLQTEYDFSEYGFTNRWKNLFEDRATRIADISDKDIEEYVAIDNYSPLIKQLKNDTDWKGAIPEIKDFHLGAEAFDEYGFAKDGSNWVAFNYKPLPSTFWPTNGSTDDVIIRLPEDFRSNSCGADNSQGRDVYIVNLALVEMTIQSLENVSIPPVNENNICIDINGDGEFTEHVTSANLRSHYVGNAQTIEVVPMLYPEGTEFLHSVRYVGVTDSGDVYVPPRMKELRYMVKTHFRSAAWLNSAYGNEAQEKIDGLLPKFVYKVEGSPNEFGWKILGFIENKEGWLRAQSQEETFFCMGCHTTIGSTIDQTFAFPRKLSGADGWGYINLKGMKDAPSKIGLDNEILEYFKIVGGGDEFRQNTEILDRWFNEDGSVKEQEVRNSDVYQLITPSRDRALALNKAYRTIVEDQDFHHGRDANLAPAVNVYENVDENSPVLPQDKVRNYDIRLNWHK